MKIELNLQKRYRDLTELEIRKLAKDIVLGNVFTAHHIPEDKAGELVFLPLLFLSDKDLEILKADPPGLIFEYNSERGPRMVNELPTFKTAQFLSVPVADKVMKEVERYSLRMADMHHEHEKAKLKKP